jgi:hypothetical protein
MAGTFGARALPVLVPPWNRIAPPVVAALPALGLAGLSTYGPRAAAAPMPGLRLVNCHADIMRWAAPRGFLGETAALGLLCSHLRARRAGQTEGRNLDATEPTGLLTHHLAHDEAAWRFLARLLPLLARHPAARLLATAQVFDAGGAGP